MGNVGKSTENKAHSKSFVYSKTSILKVEVMKFKKPSLARRLF